jgi:hypothetical protein
VVGCVPEEESARRSGYCRTEMARFRRNLRFPAIMTHSSISRTLYFANLTRTRNTYLVPERHHTTIGANPTIPKRTAQESDAGRYPNHRGDYAQPVLLIILPWRQEWKSGRDVAVIWLEWEVISSKVGCRHDKRMENASERESMHPMERAYLRGDSMFPNGSERDVHFHTSPLKILESLTPNRTNGNITRQ